MRPVSEGNENGLGKQYVYTYCPPSVLDDRLDKPRLLVSKKALTLVGIDHIAAREGAVLGVTFQPTKRSILGHHSDLEFKVSSRIFSIIKNAPSWLASDDELTQLKISVKDAQAGAVYGVGYFPQIEGTRKYKISTPLYKKLEQQFDEKFAGMYTGLTFVNSP